MSNITLVCSAHREHGKCNSIELYKIIEKIDPEIIFEELSPSRFDAYYREQSISSLETSAIMKYQKKNPISHIPVDNYDLTNIPFKDVDFMFERIFDHSIEYCQLSEKHMNLTSQHGFSYLNSNQCNETIERQHIIEIGVIREINDDKLSGLYERWTELQDNRENEIIRNINKFSNENIYDRAMLIIGAEHRNSIGVKLDEYEQKEGLNWEIYTHIDIL